MARCVNCYEVFHFLMLFFFILLFFFFHFDNYLNLRYIQLGLGNTVDTETSSPDS